MAYEAKPNTGMLFANDRKETTNHPDFKGSINIDGKDYWLSGWIKQGQKGEFYSLSIQPKDGFQKPVVRNAVPQKAVPDDLDDAIPF